MTRFTYSAQGSECRGSLYEAKRVGNKVVVTINRQEEKDNTFETDESVFTDLQAIIDKHKMYKYRGIYKELVFQILDGESWSLVVEYEDEKMSIDARGTNAGPGGYRTAFNEIKDYFINKFLLK